jgi:hypothetical protein
MLYATDRAPQAVYFQVTTGDVDGTDALGIRVVVRTPAGAMLEWDAADVVLAEESITFTHVLAADGSDLPEPGDYRFRVYLFADAEREEFLDASEESTFTVKPATVGRPA